VSWLLAKKKRLELAVSDEDIEKENPLAANKGQVKKL
jgi:hypothetical protein